MSIQFSLESIDYFAEKFNDCPSLSHESLVHLNLQISKLIFNLLQDACKVLCKCRRKDLTIDDFLVASKLHSVQPIYGGYTTSNFSFRKMKKDNRILYQIDDNIVPLDDLKNSQMKIPLDISIRTHWLATNGEQPEINENPIIEASIRTVTQKKFHKTSHILSLEQQIYYKELTEMCVCSNEQKRKQALSILSSDTCIQQILSRLVIFISEGIRVNLTSTYIRSILLQMIDALLQNAEIHLQPHLHYLLPEILSCLLDHRSSYEHWSLRDLAAKCCGEIIRKYSTAVSCLQQRIINIFYRILTKNEYTLLTQYGALIGLCEISQKVIIHIVIPLLKQIGENIQIISNDKQSLERFTQIVLKYIPNAYRPIENRNENCLNEIFGSYFAPLIHQQLILLL